MFLEHVRPFRIEVKYATGFALLALIVTFRLNSFVQFAGLTVFSACIGYVIGYTKKNVNSKYSRYGLYLIFAALFLAPILVVNHLQSIECLAYSPYEAQNIFTGETKEFVHGGCGIRTDHPWYYRITDTNTLNTTFNKTS